jgi:hypothetical protein
MEISQIFLQRYDPLYNFYLAGFWAAVSHPQMRQRPYPNTNSIAWNLWHIARCEDAGLNRFVTDRSQVLDEGSWMERMNIPWRHHGSGMTLDEVEELSRRIDLTALQDYSASVQERTRLIVNSLQPHTLDAAMEEKYLSHLLLDEGLAHSQPEGLVQNYLGWTRGKCLLSFGLTHSYQHLGEMEVLASLVGVDFG